MIMASFLAVHRHSVLMLFAVVALTLFACSSSDDSETNHSSDSSYNDSSSSSEDLSSSSSSSEPSSSSSSSLGVQTYTITYNANSGTDEVTVPAAQTKTHGENIALSTEVPTRIGYTFEGWTIEADGGGAIYYEGSDYAENSDVTFYAKWAINKYTITYNTNSGTDGATVPAAQTKTHGVDFTLSDIVPTRKYYTFSGWNTQADGKGTNYAVGGSYTENAPLTLYAQWTLNSHTLTVTVSGEGSVKVSVGGVDQPLTKTYNAGTLITITAIADDGYELYEWTGDAEGFANQIQVTIDKTLNIEANFIKETDGENSHTIIDERDGQTYKIVSINTQIWMAENLNYDAEGSKCSFSSADDCKKYGRTYNWSVAMDFDASICNNSACATEIDDKHQGICPEGWHIPSHADWDQLFRFVDGSSGTTSPYNSSTAGGFLKATEGWNGNYNGTDDYGFAALPPNGIGGLNDEAAWWTIFESSATLAGKRFFGGAVANVQGGKGTSSGNIYKTGEISVRCLKK